MKFIEFLKALGLFIPAPFSRKYKGNLLPVRMYVNIYDGERWHHAEVSDVKFACFEGNGHLSAITFQANEKN